MLNPPWHAVSTGNFIVSCILQLTSTANKLQTKTGDKGRTCGLKET